MKLQRLTIHNIASIEDAQIDFSAQPLGGSEVFLITGRTGAGKSTILDAICLALYADTPRLDTTKMQGEAQDGEKSVRIDDPRQLMRRGTGEAFVALTFTGSNGVAYEATWAVQRARRKPTGNMKKREWSLKNLATGTTLTTTKEIQDEMNRAIGLDFKQFCRTTLLAQGEFTRFLNSKDDEKAEILEKITGVDVYTRIGAKVYEVAAQKKRLWEDARQLAEGTRTLTEAEVAAKQAEMAAVEAESAAAKRQQDADKQKQTWLATDAELDAQVKRAEEQAAKAAAATASEDFKRDEQTVVRWNDTIDARNCLVSRDQARKDATRHQSDIAALRFCFAAVLGGLAFEEQKKAAVEARIKQTEAFLEAETPKASLYANAQTAIGHLRAMADGRAETARQQAVAAAEGKRLTDTLAPALEKARREADAAKALFVQAQEALTAEEESLKALDLPQQRRRQSDAKERLHGIKTALEHVAAMAEAREKAEAEGKRLEAAKADIEAKKTQLADVRPKAAAAEVRMRTCSELLERQKDSVDKFAKAMRSRLRVGDTCPVCRQEIAATIPHEEELAELVGSLTAAFKEAEQDYRAIEAGQHKIEAEIRTQTQTWERDKARLEADTSVAKARQRMETACRACGLAKVEGDVGSALIATQKQTQSLLAALDGAIRTGELKEKAVESQRKALEKLRSHWDAKAAAVRRSEQEADACSHRASVANELAQAKQKDIRTAEAAAAELIAGEWPMDWTASPKEFAEMLQGAADAYAKRQREGQALVQTAKELEGNILQAREIVARLGELIPAWKDERTPEAAELPRLVSAANELGGQAATAVASAQQAAESERQSQQQLDSFLAARTDITEEVLAALNAYPRQAIAQKSDALEQARREESSCKTLLQDSLRRREEHARQRPELGPEDTAEAIGQRIAESEARMAELNMRKGALGQELKADADAKRRLGQLIADADRKKEDYLRWGRINQLIGDASGSKFRKIAQSYVLKSLIHAANAYMKTLSDRYTLRVVPGTFVISLEDAYQGFVSRAATTLSGGESFLVSLSLALALSDIGSQLAVDTLFVDEGFGTLSGEPLQNAVETLRSLHSKSGRHVGIISHVEELQERIPVQIQVVQAGHSSRSEVRVVG